jgi:hypothetical protein
MKMTDLQFAALNISLSTLGQVDISDNDPEALRTLEYLLEAASKNVKRALSAIADEDRQFRIAEQNEDRMGWLNMSNGEEVP